MDTKSGPDKGSLIRKALEGTAAERVSRFGSAVKEHIVAYTGKNSIDRREYVYNWNDSEYRRKREEKRQRGEEEKHSS